jgi:large subunit ribosomal protein L21
MFAVIQTGGKQYRVSPGETIKIEKLEGEENAVVSFDSVLLTVDGDNMQLGNPTVKGAVVTGKILGQERARKVIVFKYKQKTRRRTKNTHRQPYTEVEITKIS